MKIRSAAAAFLGAFIGSSWARSNHALNMMRASRSFMDIDYIKDHSDAFAEPLTDDESAPIFILSAGWRSGSTLLQRMVCSSSDTIIWGEPYAYCDLVPSLAARFLPFSEDWPNPKWFISSGPADLQNDWIANLYPSLSDFRAAHKCLLERLLRAPAVQAGYKHWGLKEVRLTIQDAAYLRWLYPQCKLLLLVRNPYHAYASYKGIGSRNYAHWPDQPIFTPWQFGKMWARSVSGFQSGADRINALFVRYEDLGSRQTAEAIGVYLGKDVPPASKMSRVGESGQKPLGQTERTLMSMALGDAAKKLGYSAR